MNIFECPTINNIFTSLNYRFVNVLLTKQSDKKINDKIVL